MADGVSVVSAAVVSGELILGLSSGQLIRAGFVQGPQGLRGDPGPKGDTGRPGADGNTLLHGAGAPTFDDGKPGDFYIDTSRSWLYGPKTGTGWGSAVKLKPDPATLKLPTGFKAEQGDPIYPRVFAGAMAGGGGGGTVMVGGGSGDGNLSPILGNNAPLAAGTPLVVASDPVGDAMIVDLWALGPNGTLFVEVGVSKGTGTDTGYSVVYEIQMGTQPPVLTFTPIVTGAGGLQLQVSSDVALTTLRGRVLLL